MSMTVVEILLTVGPSQAMVEAYYRDGYVFAKAFQIFVHLQNMAGKLFPLRCRVELLAEYLPEIITVVHCRGRQPHQVAMLKRERMCMMVIVTIFMHCDRSLTS
jgi:hypothetical protein